jgi:hypothetical protein
VSTPDNAYRQNVDRIGHGSSQFPQRVASIANIFDALLKDIDAGLVDHTGKKLASVPQTVVKIFISHSSRDVALAAALVELIRTALNLPSSAIRCTSVPGYKLLGGAKTESQLRGELLAAPVFIGLVTEASLSSAYVLFELGARWGANMELIPLMAPGLSPEALEGPISSINALSCSSSVDLHRLITQIAEVLGIKPEPPESYQSDIDFVTNLPVSTSLQEPVSSVPQSAVDALADLRAEAVHKILNRQVTRDADLVALASYRDDWCERIDRLLERNFSRAELYNEAHAKILREYVLQERRLLDIIARHTR